MPMERAARALVVDDHPTNRLVLKIFLEEALGADVHEAADGAAAVELFRSGRFDLVFMDIEMPVMNGLAATAAIRELEQQSGQAAAPIIVVSAFCGPEDRLASVGAGATAHIAKPLAFEALSQVIRDACAPLQQSRAA